LLDFKKTKQFIQIVDHKNTPAIEPTGSSVRAAYPLKNTSKWSMAALSNLDTLRYCLISMAEFIAPS
jgi:hypothetical protein